MFLNEAENDISLCARCTKPLTADAQQEENEPAQVSETEIVLTDNPSEAEQDFDQEALDEIEGATEEESEDEEEPVRTTDFRRRQPLTGLAVVW